MRSLFKVCALYANMFISVHASESILSQVPSKDVSEFYAGHLEKVDDVELFDTYTTVLKVEEGSLVKNVLRGRVTFLGKSKKFGKVVVMEHKDNLHTIYVHLSQIAPTIKIGSKLMQGYYVGKTTDSFGFKVQRAENMKVLDALKNFNGGSL